jgi:dTDP-4-amino-4,6-dideoxygalactose transaminase
MKNAKAVPFLDLVTPHAELREELCAVFNAALDSGGFIGGPMVHGFEQDFARFCDADHCVGVGSGTDALRFLFIAAGIGADDIVITVPHTFIATTEAISQAGARPVFVDIDEDTYNMDVAKLREYLETECDFDSGTKTLKEKKTKERIAAVVPVHLYGQTADMDPLIDLAEQYNLIVIEDACQAQGAERLAQWVWPAHSAFIRVRIWVLAARQVLSQPMMATSPKKCGCCAITAKHKSIFMT